ncbi:MAG: hypothetical protein IPK60_22360 [Sandaracinaceae bacterium]|nr:hypothetical protein [Sandaracinaceae bacterium]
MNHARRNVEDIVLGLLLIAVGVLRVGIAISANEVWEFEPSVAFGLVVVGAYVFVCARNAASTKPVI